MEKFCAKLVETDKLTEHTVEGLSTYIKVTVLTTGTELKKNRDPNDSYTFTRTPEGVEILEKTSSCLIFILWSSLSPFYNG